MVAESREVSQSGRESRRHSVKPSDEKLGRERVEITRTGSGSILPTLGGTDMGSHGNNSGPTGGSETAKESAELFFFEKRAARAPVEENRASQNNPLVGNLQRTGSKTQSPTPQFIQPRARPVGPPRSLVIDVKKQVDDIGLPSLKVNRSLSNLAGMGSSTLSSFTNLAALSGSTGTATGPARRALGRPSPFTLHLNGSTGSLHEDHDNNMHVDSNDWANDFNDMSHARSTSKLAPYGGFSKPSLEEGIGAQENIFETAPWRVVSHLKGNGSLTKAVDSALEHGNISLRKWVGTLAMPTDAVPERVKNDISAELQNKYDCETVFPNDDIFQGHYKSFCKQILWPTLHYQIPDDPKSKAFEEHSWEQYRALNQLVADKVVETYRRENGSSDPSDPENMIWIHDYHLLLVPRMVRAQLPDAQIGFFLHVSFPLSEVFRCFAQRTSLLDGVLASNCISFQTEEYVRHFLQTCSRLLLADTNELGLTYDGNFVMTTTIPIGIDAEQFDKLTHSSEVQSWRQKIRTRWGDSHLIVSRDKLDKLRGIKQKLLAYELFLRANPAYVNTSVLIQICIGSGHDPEYESDILAIVSRINALADNIAISQPVVFLQQDIAFDQYVALQCEADVFVVSSMREGLNLTCHEFVIATTEKKAPLMISEFAGSSQLLECKGEGALLINPWGLKAFAETFKELLSMPQEERARRWENMHDTVLTHDLTAWVVSCLRNIHQAWAREAARHNSHMIRFTEEVFGAFMRGKGSGRGENRTTELSLLPQDGENQNTTQGDNDLLHPHQSSGQRLFFLNLETATVIGGQDPNTVVAALRSVTHAAAVAGKSNSFSEPTTVSKLLENLLADHSNLVYLVSVLRRLDLDRLYSSIPRLGLVAENGGYIKVIGSRNWLTLADEQEVSAWMPQVRQLIQSKVERLPGSFMEVEDCTVSFRPGKAFIEDRERSIDMMGDCIQHVNDLFQQLDGIHASICKNVVVVQQNLLSLRALEFLVEFHNVGNHGPAAADIIGQFKAKLALSPNTLSAVLSPVAVSPPAETGGISSVFVVGGATQIDEPCFEYANSLAGEGYRVLTVASFGAEANLKSSARYCVGGKNEVLVALSRVH